MLFKKKMVFKLETPRAGFEPATNRLTADRSTAELPRKALDEPSLDED